MTKNEQLALRTMGDRIVSFYKLSYGDKIFRIDYLRFCIVTLTFIGVAPNKPDYAVMLNEEDFEVTLMSTATLSLYDWYLFTDTRYQFINIFMRLANCHFKAYKEINKKLKSLHL